MIPHGNGHVPVSAIDPDFLTIVTVLERVPCPERRVVELVVRSSRGELYAERKPMDIDLRGSFKPDFHRWAVHVGVVTW